MLGAPGAAAARAVAAWAGAADPLAGQILGFGPLAASLAAVALMIGWQITRGRWRDIRRKHRDAGLLGVELALVAEVIKATDWLRSTTAAQYEHRLVPRGVYDGLAGSGRLADFDLPTQEFLYRFYWHGSIGDHASMRLTAREAIDRVERIREESAPGARPALGRLARFVARWGRRGRGAGAPARWRGPGRGAPGPPAGGGGGGGRNEGGRGAPFGQAEG